MKCLEAFPQSKLINMEMQAAQDRFQVSAAALQAGAQFLACKLARYRHN